MKLHLLDFDHQEHEFKSEDEDPQQHDEDEGESGFSMQFAHKQQEEFCITGAAATKTPRCVSAIVILVGALRSLGSGFV